MAGYTIGRLAKEAGVGVETIRYYQRRGLLDTPTRPPGGVRRYPLEALARLTFIRRAQEFGFTLEEIAGLQKLAPEDCGSGQGFVRAKHAELGDRIDALRCMRTRLESYILGEGARTGERCPFLSMLIGDAA